MVGNALSIVKFRREGWKHFTRRCIFEVWGAYDSWWRLISSGY